MKTDGEVHCYKSYFPHDVSQHLITDGKNLLQSYFFILKPDFITSTVSSFIYIGLYLSWLHPYLLHFREYLQCIFPHISSCQGAVFFISSNRGRALILHYAALDFLLKSFLTNVLVHLLHTYLIQLHVYFILCNFKVFSLLCI